MGYLVERGEEKKREKGKECSAIEDFRSRANCPLAASDSALEQKEKQSEIAVYLNKGTLLCKVIYKYIKRMLALFPRSSPKKGLKNENLRK